MLIHLILATLASYAGAQGGLSDNSDKCFMTVAAREGFITSPGYPSSYTNNLNCTYVFVGVRPTQIISLRLYELDVERCSGSDPGCDCDWLSIDGRQKLCQNTTFQESYVFRDRFVILFRSDGSGSGRGFQLRYSVGMDPHDNCTFTLTNKTGEITSPGYPDYYINSLYCKYVFVGEGHSQIITIYLLDLDLYYCFIHNEWLIIDDGTKLCLPTTFHKTYVFRDRFIISFQTFKWGITSNSIYSSSSRGFKLHYSVGMEANDTCTSIHTKTSGQISRPCSSCNCADNNCTNTIIGSGKLQTLILDFVSLNFMTKANCDAGWFTIGGGPRICTSEPFKTIYVFHGSVDIVTHGGQRSVSSCPGFIVNYAVQDNCSATFTASEGEIASPGYPGNFTDNMNCTYVIVGDGRRQIITIDPLELDLTDCSYYRCHCDWFIIGDGPKLCHDTTFQKTYVFRDRFIITFGTDIGSSRFWRRGRRFRMHYSIGTDVNDKCTSTHIKTSGQISTPCSSCNCSYNNCTNTIMGSGELQTLTLDFVSLNAMASTNCDMGWFTMGGGAKICTSAPFKTTYAFLGSLDIVTHGGDRSVNSCPGFVVNYAVQDNCTTTFTASEGEITSPGYPGIWIVLSCTYVIVGDEHTQIISLDLVEFDRTPCWSLGIGCTCDWLIINDGPTVCGITRFQKKYVFQDRFVIKYRTDYRESSRGFRMRYSLGTDANETCTSTHIKTSGQISTPCSSCNCTFNHCTNTIVGSGKLQAVILDFVSLNFTTSAYCTMGWFTIDGGKRICTSTPFKTAYAFYGSIDIVTHGRDRSVSSCPGFIVNYAVQDNCSVTLTASEGLITSPPNPGTESIYISCTYIIVGDGSAQSIAIDLLEINLEEGGNCYYDWLIIHDGPKLCYHTTFRKTYAFRNRFIIKFRSSYFNTKEFKIYYSVGMGEYDTCSSIHTKTSGQISTPCYSCNCTYNNCTNTIMGSWTLKILTLDFVSLNFTTSPNCDAGWFTIDGGPKICPSRPFKTIYAFYGSIDIVTHGGDRSRDTCPNFVVNYDIQDVDNNTLTYNTNSGQLVGPIFPGNGLYSFAKLTCIIVGRFPSQNLTLDITLTFHYSGKCTYNRLTLNNTEELCRTGTYHRTYLSQNNFITELANTYGAGFVIQYKREDIIEATTTTTSAATTPSTCGPMADASLDGDCSNARCVAVNSSCVTTSAGNRRCACINKNVQISTTGCSMGPSILSSKKTSVFATDLSGTSQLVGSIPLDELSKFPTVTFSTEASVYPDEGILDLRRSSERPLREIDVVLVKEIRDAQTFVVVLRATAGEFTVQQLVTVRITSSFFTPENVTVMLVEGTRKGTLIADVRTIGSLVGYSNYNIETTDDTARALLRVTASGQVLCGQDIFLSNFTNNDVVAKEYIASVTATKGEQRATVATFYILFFRSSFTKMLSENWIGNILSYSITSSRFRIDIKEDTLPDRLRLTKDLTTIRLVNGTDYEAGIRSIHFTLDLVTTDSAKSTTVDVRIKIEDQNDEPPEFQKAVYDFSLLAGSKRNSVVGVVSATDKDTTGQTSFQLEGAYKDDFTINDDGILTSKVDLTRGRFPSTIPLRVKAYDGVHYSEEANITVYLISYTSNVINLNRTSLGSVSENSPPGTYVADVAVSNYTGYKFANPRADRLFRVNSTSGTVTTAVGLDREDNDHAYTDFTILAYMDSNDQCSPVTIGQLITTVTDVNDNAPTFSRPPYTGSVKENSTTGTLVDGLVDVVVTDDDIGENGAVNFALTGTGSNYFAVEKSNHNQFTIKTSGTPVDREVTPYVVLTLTGTDNPSNPQTGSTTLNITVIDINDNAPQFNPGTTVFSVEENAGPTSITTLTATDKDEGRNGQVSYSLVEGGFGLFAVDESTGAVSTIKEIDRENRDVFNLSIEARDQGSPSFASDLTITVNISDVNDEKPIFSQSFYKVNYVENAPCTTNVLTVAATDLDEGSNANIRFSTTNSNFTVDPTSGAIRCANPLDYEAMQQHLIEIKAENPGTPSMSDTVTVEINVEDVNDNSPRFDKTSYQSEITTWELVTNNPVDVFEVTDDDSGTNGQFTFSMSGETDKFFVDGETVGVLRIKAGATQPGASTTYKFDVTATDKGSPPRSVSVPVTVQVKKIEGNRTVYFRENDIFFPILENQVYTTPFGTAKALHDVTVSVTYSLIRGGDFRIDPTSGELTCSTPQDRETAPSHTMIVRAIDLTTNASDLAVIKVTVEDENDNSPRFLTIPAQHVFSVQENSVNMFVARIMAEDNDAGENGTITYSIESQTPRTHFSIDHETGRITVSGDVDREAFHEYRLIIKAADKADVPRTATTQAIILIIDINDNHPTFQTPYEVTVKENSALSTSVGTVSATDRDTPHYAAVTYVGNTAMENGTVCPFSVSVETGVVKVSGDLDYETTSTYECIVTAIDTWRCNDCTGRLTGSTTLSVTILDFNDNPPVFQGAPYRANISRAAGIDSLVTDTITATDRDGVKHGNGVVKYHIFSSTDYFKIDRDTGNISVATALDAVDEDEVTLRIKATDLPQTDPAMEAITEVTISIITDKPRPFFKKEYTFNLKENERPDEDKRVAMTAYVRTESGEFACNCTYEILVSDYSGKFHVDSMTGELRQRDEIDREETGSRFYVTVKATDGVTGLYRTKQVEIIVADVNDNFPYFQNTQQNFTVRQSAPVGYVIGRVTSLDADELSRPIYTAFTANAAIEVQGDGKLVVRASLLNYTDVHIVVNVKEDRFEGTIDVSASTNTNVYINIRPDYNQHAPTFGKDTYEASLMFLSRKGTEVQINDFRATDADGDSVTYAIQRGNFRDTFTIDSETGKISLQYTLDDTVPLVVELVVTATDSSSYPMTGSCIVTISLRDFTATACIAENAYSELQVRAQQRLIFLGLFIAMAVLLAVTSLIAIFAMYKWRTTSHTTPPGKDEVETAQEMEPIPMEYDLLAANRPELRRSYYRRLGRNSSPGVPDEGYLTPVPRPTPPTHPDEGSPPYDDADAYSEVQA